MGDNLNPSSPERAASADRISAQDVTLKLLDSYESRLKLLEENKDKNSVSAKIQKTGGLIALLIGIVLSTISLFDIFLIKPNENLVRDIGEFNKAVNAVANLRQNMVQLQFQTPNPEMLQAANSMVLPQVLANIHTAMALLPRLDDQVGIPQLIVLTFESMNIFDWESARVFVDRAVAIKSAAPSLQSEARRYKGRLLFLMGNLPEGRKAFRDSLDTISKENAFGINGVRAYIVSDWIVSEFTLGDCAAGTELVGRFIEYVQQPQIPAQTRNGLIAALNSQLAALQWQSLKRCPVPKELQQLMPSPPQLGGTRP